MLLQKVAKVLGIGSGTEYQELGKERKLFMGVELQFWKMEKL